MEDTTKSETSQQETSQALAAGPGSVTVKDRTFLIEKFNTASVFTVYEWATEQAKVAYNPFVEVMTAIKGLDVTPEERSFLLSQAHRVKIAGEVPGDQITKSLRSVEGVAFTLWVLARPYHADLTFEECKDLVTEDNRADVYCTLDTASGANMINKAALKAGFFQPASAPATTGLSDTVGPQS